MGKKDNAGKQQKIYFRHMLLEACPPTAVMETNGGYGVLFNALYRQFRGVVFEKNPKKASALAFQRPEWAVYETNSIQAISRGVGFHLPVNFFDLDPYGESMPLVDAILKNAECLPPRWGIVINDGNKQSCMRGRAWKISYVKEYVQQYGNKHIKDVYKEILEEIISKKVQACGYEIVESASAYGGFNNQMTHFCAVMQKKAPDKPGQETEQI